MKLSEIKKPPKISFGRHKSNIETRQKRNPPDGIKQSGTPDTVTGCHFTGPVALRHTLSSALPKCIFSFGSSLLNYKHTFFSLSMGNLKKLVSGQNALYNGRL